MAFDMRVIGIRPDPAPVPDTRNAVHAMVELDARWRRQGRTPRGFKPPTWIGMTGPLSVLMTAELL